MLELTLLVSSSILIYLALLKRSFYLYFRSNPKELETKATPFSRFLTNLIANAGGIYLSLMLLSSFLEISLPEEISLNQVQIDPLAAVALGLALLQPLFFSCYFKIKKLFTKFP